MKSRWGSTTPKFFKKIRNIAIAVGTLAVTVISLNTTMSLELPTELITACEYIIAACTALGLNSQLTREK